MVDKPVPTQRNDDELFVGASNHESQKFVSVDDNTMRIKPTIGSLALSVLLVLIGLGLAVYWAAVKFGIVDNTDTISLLFFGVIFVVVGLCIYRGSNEQIVINRDAGVAFIKSWSPTVSLDKKAVAKHIQSNEIVAIQSTSRMVESHTRKRTINYTQYQVNLYTCDEKRHNVFVTLNPENAENLGNKLAALFSVPLQKS